MPLINVNSSYFNHPKTRRLKVYLSLESDVFPIRLWAFAAEYFPKDGILKGYSGLEIEGILGFNGNSGNLIRALQTVGFVEKVENDFAIHDWQEHAGFVWNYKLSGQKGGRRSGISRRKNQSNPPFKRNGKSLQAKRQNASTMEWNGMELNKDNTLRFEKPSATLVTEYAQTLAFDLDGQAFVDYYDSKGWLVGKSAMRDWRAAVRTWKRHKSTQTQPPPNSFQEVPEWQKTK